MLKRGKKEGKCIYIMPARPYTYIIEKKKGFCKPFLFLRYNNDLNDRLYTGNSVFYGDSF